MCIFISTVEFVLCVLGRGGGVSGDGVGSNKEGKRRRRLRDLIIQRIDHPSDDVSTATYRLTFAPRYLSSANVYYRSLSMHTMYRFEGAVLQPTHQLTLD